MSVCAGPPGGPPAQAPTSSGRCTSIEPDDEIAEDTSCVLVGGTWELAKAALDDWHDQDQDVWVEYPCACDGSHCRAHLIPGAMIRPQSGMLRLADFWNRAWVSRRAASSSQTEPPEHVVTGDAAVFAHRVEDTAERADLELSVSWDRHMVLAVRLRREPHVAARLPGDLVAEGSKRGGEVGTGEAPRPLHRDSSRSL